MIDQKTIWQNGPFWLVRVIHRNIICKKLLELILALTQRMDDFQIEKIEPITYCIGHDNQSDANVSRLTKKEAAAAELINNACDSRGSTISSTGIYLTTHDNQYDQYNATYMEPRDLPRCGRGIQIQADVEVEVVESSTLTPTSNLPPPPPSLVNSPDYHYYHKV